MVKEDMKDKTPVLQADLDANSASEKPLKRSQERAYDDPERIRELVAKKKHRSLVGMAWDTMGTLQLELLKTAGMQPEHNVLDVGCGCLRAGVKIIPYLEPNHYYGIDWRQPLLGIGFNRELKKADLEPRLSRENLFTSGVFEHARLAEGSIDYGLCVGIFTHHNLNQLRVMLENTAKYFKPGGQLFVSFLELPEGQPFAKPFTNAEGVKTRGHKVPYHYYRRDMEYMAKGAGWDAHYVGAWGEPDGQALIRYQKS
jgi:SAM-dependent methyltransferase